MKDDFDFGRVMEEMFESLENEMDDIYPDLKTTDNKFLLPFIPREVKMPF